LVLFKGKPRKGSFINNAFMKEINNVLYVIDERKKK